MYQSTSFVAAFTARARVYVPDLYCCLVASLVRRNDTKESHEVTLIRRCLRIAHNRYPLANASLPL